MKRLVMLAVLVAAGCSSVARQYVKPGASTEEFASDKMACKAQAISQNNAFLVGEIWDACMQGRGWRPVPES